MGVNGAVFPSTGPDLLLLTLRLNRKIEKLRKRIGEKREKKKHQGLFFLTLNLGKKILVQIEIKSFLRSQHPFH